MIGSWAMTAAATPFPGPDGFGYSGASIAFNWCDIYTTGTQAFGGIYTNDTVTGAIGMGFGFSFYGTTYSDVYMGSNGFITISAGQSQGCCSGSPLPGTSDLSNLVAGRLAGLPT